MAAKRKAGIQITADTWDQDNDDEDTSVAADSFTRASENEMMNRQIKKAKRTLPVESSRLNEKSVFSSIKLTPTPQFNQPASISSPDYLQKLRSLNFAVLDWIGKHIKANPNVDLSPVFHDYFKHLASIGKDPANPVQIKNTINNDSATDSKPAETIDNESSDEQTMDQKEEEKEKERKEEEEEEETGDHLMSVKSKLFYKKDSQYIELGVGQLHVDQPSEGNGVHLLLRNNTTIGKILLNVILRGRVPISVQKNNLLLVCPANPPLDIKPSNTTTTNGDDAQVMPTTYLIRVKDQSAATNLHSLIQQHLK